MLDRLPVLDIEGPPLASPRDWQVQVGGLVEAPARLCIGDIKAMEPAEETVPIICVEGWDMWVRWKGVRMADIIRRCRPKPEAKYLTFYSYSEYTDSLPLEDAMDERTLLAYGLDGADLPPEHGGPVRLVVPFKLAYKSVKWVTRITFTDKEEKGYWEIRSGYPAEAGVPEEKKMQYGL
ncbi:molybdopterin-dependent oxidoreductase [Methanocella sp. MCL-LM]|uniref:molybdopterin-dependent oxidoreductase n=1 Tax=Methanocella sp. MCL-LM TaxID=3412035 RepID=UPI003C774953